jgi:SAM-dependent methyltransferase
MKLSSTNFEGYPLEIDYSFHYHHVVAPSILKLATLNRFLPFPRREPLRYLELGYGNGISLNIHAAASPGEYWGIDVNPSHASFANGLAEAARSQMRALNLSFADFLAYRETPNFDVIVAPGIWSWVSQSNRQVIVDIVRQKLVAGGIFYVSYNALPGSAAIIPLQELFHIAMQSNGSRTAIRDRITAAISLMRSLQAADSSFFSSSSAASERLEQLETLEPSDLYHEYMVDDWRPTSFARTARVLSRAGLNFVGSANLLDHYDDLVFNSRGRKFLESVQDGVLRETLRDFLRNRQFRCDLYVKGDGEMLRLDRDEIFQDLSFIMVMPEESVARLITPTGPMELSKPPFVKLLSALAEDGYRMKSVSELAKRYLHNGIEIDQIVRALMLLVQSGIVHPVQDSAVVGQAADSCRRLNEEILVRSQFRQTVQALASPITGAGIPVSRAQQLFLLALKSGEKAPDGWAKFAWDILHQESMSENRQSRDEGRRSAILAKKALEFLRCLPIFFRLGIADFDDLQPMTKSKSLPE